MGSLHVWSGTGRVRAPVIRVRAGSGLDMQCAGCGAGFLDSLRGGDGLPALGHGAGSGSKGEPAQTSSHCLAVLWWTPYVASVSTYQSGHQRRPFSSVSKGKETDLPCQSSRLTAHRSQVCIPLIVWHNTHPPSPTSDTNEVPCRSLVNILCGLCQPHISQASRGVHSLQCPKAGLLCQRQACRVKARASLCTGLR